MSAPTRRPAAANHGASLARVTAALEHTVGFGRPAGAWTKYCCPVHEADGHHNPSLIVKHFADKGRTKVQCQAGCPDEQILDAIGLKVSDLYDEPITRAAGGRRAPIRPRPQQRRPVSRAEQAIAAAGLPLTKPAKDLGRALGPAKTVATYTYCWPDGRVEGEVVRRHTQHEHGRDKSFYQRRADSRTGGMQAGGFAALPYRLPEVLDAIEQGRSIYVVEGEEDVNAAWRAGIPATCNAAGAGKWKPEHAQWLEGARRVVIIADRDAPGYRHADKVAASLAGLVGEVRIVAAAEGKDLRDHLAAGHEIAELQPVAGLDYRTPTTSAARSEAGAVPFAGEASPNLSADASPLSPDQTLDGGSFMSGNSTVNLSGLHGQEAGHHHDDTIDHIGSKFAMLIRGLMQDVLTRANESARRRREALKEQEQRDAKKAREQAAALAAQRKAAETALEKMRKTGWDRLSRSEVAVALHEAVTWSEESDTARRAAVELASHIKQRWGVEVDLSSGKVTVDEDMTPKLAAKMAAAEQERAAKSRLATAQDRLVEMIAAEDIDESVKQELYAQVEAWRNEPSVNSLSALTKKMKAAGLGDEVRARARFVAIYLGEASAQPMSVNDTDWVPVTPAAAEELRRIGKPVVDLGEEAKYRVDTLLLDYQARLKSGLDTVGVQARLAEAVSVMTEKDREIARERGKQIRKNPAEARKPLWPDHVNRDELATTVRAYAALAPIVEARIALDPDGKDPEARWDKDQRQRAEVMRAQIDKAIKSGKGLADIERDQLRAVLTDIEAGKTQVPDTLLADDRSAAAIERERRDNYARAYAEENRREIEKILSTAAAPEGTVRAVRDDLNRVVLAQTALAAGRTSRDDYEATQAEEQLRNSMITAGVPEHVRLDVNQFLAVEGDACEKKGERARAVQDQWAGRREKVAAERNPGPPAYDSPERLALLEYNLRQAGLTEDQRAQRLAAAAGRAKPPSEAVKPPTPEARARQTASGTGIAQAYNRDRDRDTGHER